MQESSVYQYITEKARAEGIEQGIEQGAKESTIEAIILILDARFETNTAYRIKSLLETIDDLSSLKHSLRYATEAESLEAFISHLSNGNVVLP